MESRGENFLKKLHFLLDEKNRQFCLDLLFPCTSVYFSGPAGGRSLRARVPYMEGVWLVELFCRRLIPSPGWLAEVVTKIVLGFAGCSTSNYEKSVNSFCPTIFFTCFYHMWLLFGDVISPNKCVTPRIHITKRRCHGVTWRKFGEKHAFLMNEKKH